MNLDGLTSAFTLSSLTVSPNDLLLDPRNPRLITESAQDRSYTTQQIKSVKTQDFVRHLVCSKEHDVKRLISSIREMGFVGGLHEVIVKDIGSSGPYLVIEGNRRTAAMQYLLRGVEKLRSEVRKSIKAIQVKKFVYRKNRELSEDNVIDVLLGSIHIDGPKEWGALERAHYVHRSYMRVFGDRRTFHYDPAVSKDVGSTFKMSPKAVHKCLKICRVYEQLRRAKVGIEPKHYTLIDLATKTRDVAGPYFELDSETCELSDVGLERFVELVLGEKPPIHNPKLFDAFVEVYTDGTPLERSEIASGVACLEDTRAAIRRRKERREFRDELEDIKRRIGDLYVDGFRGTESEKALILRIQHLVDTRLVPLGRVRS
jgi:hypothetical protein